MLIPEKAFSSLRYIWAYLCMEYLLSLPYSLIDVLNKTMKFNKGHLLMVAIVIYLESSLFLGGLSIPGIKSSFARRVLPQSCLYYTIMVPLLFYLQSVIYDDRLTFTPPLSLWNDLIFGYKKHFSGWR